MVKKAKNGKKNGGKKKVVEGKKENKMSFAEALLAFQIEIKEASIDQYLAEVKHVEEKNKRYKERNEQLKAEQLAYITKLLEEAKKQDKLLESKEVVNREQVDQAIGEKWQFINLMNKGLEDMRDQIEEIITSITQIEFERDYWLEYKNVGSDVHATQIQLLEMEIEDIKQNIKKKQEQFKQSLEDTKIKITLQAEKDMNERKELATENAIMHIDKFSRKEIKENSWLSNQVSVYKQEINDLKIAVRKIEQENLKLISQLFDCRLQDLRISRLGLIASNVAAWDRFELSKFVKTDFQRNCFLTQVAGLDVPADGLLGEDMETLKLMYDSDAVQTRPKSATLAMVKQKLFAAKEGESEQEKRLWSETSDFCLSQKLPNLMCPGEKDFQEYLQLGPLEMKLLSIVGHKMPIHKDIISRSTKANMQDGYVQTGPKWPITYQRIQSTVAYPQTDTVTEG